MKNLLKCIFRSVILVGCLSILLFSVAFAQTSNANSNPTDTKLDLGQWVAISGAFIAAFSAFYAYISGRLSRGTIAYEFMVRYSNEKMRDALRLMGEVRSKYKGTLMAEWTKALKAKEQWAKDVDDARHTIKYFYRDVAILYQTKCIKYKTAKKICSAGGIYLFDTIIREMDQVVNNYKYPKEFHPIQKIIISFKRKERYRRMLKLHKRISKKHPLVQKVYKYYIVYKSNKAIKS